MTSELPRDANARQSSGGARISSKDDQHLWPSLYEKALATARGGYQNLEGALASDVLRAVTGRSAPQQDDPRQLLQSFAQGHPVVVSTSRSAGGWDGLRKFDSRSGGLPGSAPATTRYGETTVSLEGSHAYSVKSVSNGTVTLQNPWNDPVLQGGGEVKMSVDAFARILGVHSNSATTR